MISGRSNEQPLRFRIPFLLLLSLYCAWIFTLPLFPSLDGSLHLYYASVLGSLLSGSKDFASYYFIRHVLPPYALHYYFLIAAAHFFGYVMADKLLVCLIFIVTAFGFRYLAGYLGPSGDLISLFMIPLLLTWPLGMGFYNYCLAIGMAFWALGFWYRAVQKRSHRLWLAFLITVILMVLTHPVPLLIIYILVGIDVAWRLRGYLRRGQRSANTPLSYRGSLDWDILYALLTWSTVIYIAYFTSKSRVVANVLHIYNRKAVLIKLAKLSTLAMFSGSHPIAIAYRLSLYAILFLACVLAFVAAAKHWKNRIYTPANAILACSLLLMIAIPILPPVMNGAEFFSQRLVVLVWIGALAAAGGHARMTRRVRFVAAGVACLYAIAALSLANTRIRPIARQLASIETITVPHDRLTGITLSLPNAPETDELDYFPFYWAAARYFRRSHSTLLNGGWMYESYLPLGSHVDSIAEQLTPQMVDSPGNVYFLLRDSRSAQEQIMPHANLVVWTGYADPDTLRATLDAWDRNEPSRIWSCQPQNWYTICTAPFANLGQ